jgi:hypothetical protein
VRRRLLASYLSITLFVLIALGLPLGVSYANTEHSRLEHDVGEDAFGFSQRAGALIDEGTVDARARLEMVVDR